MGCLYSRARTTIRHTRSFATTDVNGIARVPLLVLTGVNGTHSPRNGADGKAGTKNGNTRVLIKPPPPPPPPSPPHSPDSSPTFDVPGLNVQYAEDLEPVEQEMPDEVRARVLPQRNHISQQSNSVSTHVRSATGSHVRSHGLKETHEILHSDMALEELDTDTDITISGSRHHFSENERKNPSATDILIPRLKDDVSHGHSPTLLIRRKQQSGEPTQGRHDSNALQLRTDTQNLSLQQNGAIPSQALHEPNSASQTGHELKQKLNHPIKFRSSPGDANAKPPHSRRHAKSPQPRHGAKSPYSRHSAKSPELRDGMISPKSRQGAKSPESRNDAKSPKTQINAKSPRTRQDAIPPQSRNAAKSAQSRQGARFPHLQDKTNKNADQNPEVLNNALPSVVRYDASLQLTDVSSDGDGDDIVFGNYSHNTHSNKGNESETLENNLSYTLETNNSLSFKDGSIDRNNGEQNVIDKSAVTISNKTQNEAIEPNVQRVASSPIPSTPKALYEQELQKSRDTRKRKRLRKRQKAEQTSRRPKPFDMGHQEANTMTPDVALQYRPTSGVSTWTANSRETLNSRNATQASTPFGSTDTLHSFDMDGTDAGAPYELPLYPHLQTGVTPISFNGLADDYPTGIIDLDDADHQAGNGSDDSWLDANKSTFDAWYGMKPYNVMGSSSRRDSDAHVPNSDPVASGPTSSALQTKQKLLYSRFARRPQSDSVLRMRGRPPLPPGKDVHLRPTSETQRKTQTFSRYFASDLDIR